MIGCDLAVLSLLKTYSLMRSKIRYYTIGLDKKKEWRMKLEKATNYEQFMEVRIQEPLNTAPIATKNRTKQGDGGRLNYVLKTMQLRWRRLFCRSTTDTMTSNNMKRAQSCAQLHHDTIDASLHRTPSCLSLATRAQHDTEGEQLRKDLENELGTKGGMLLATTSRLREARLQASSTTVKRARKARRFLQASSSFGAVSCGAVNNSTLVQTICEDQNLIAAQDIIHNGINDHDDDNDNDNDDDYDDESSNDDDFADNKVNDPVSAITFLLTGIVKRNHLSVEDILINDAQSVMECGRHRLSQKARDAIMGYHEEVAQCLDWIAEFGSCLPPSESPLLPEGGSSSPNGHRLKNDEWPAISPIKSYPDPNLKLMDRINLVRRMKHNMGRSALMLSGGGAQAMYHLGTVKALCESGLYKDIPVISGTSGGSIVAAMCAIKTSEELLKDACVSHVSTDYGLNGEMKRDNIRWFPKLVDMGTYWLQHRLLVDSKEFKRCCDFYYADITFEEAFERTGKHVCITVSASRAEDTGGSGAQRLLLNHISTPHVTISSAVAASCALPGVMAAAKLATKNSVGKKEPFEVDGVEWIDGSVQADLPFKRISTLFNVSNYIVCQTNFHVLPFLHKPHHPNPKSFYWRAFQTCEWDMRNRALNLSRFGLFPKSMSFCVDCIFYISNRTFIYSRLFTYALLILLVFGHDISKVFKQKYHGNLTLVPRFTTMQVFGLNALANPTVKDMERYLQNGQAAAWPYLSVIKEMLRLETSIDRCISRLTERMHQVSPTTDFSQNFNNDLVSDASASYASRAFMFSAHRETELLKEKVSSLEIENSNLRRQMEQMNRAVGISMLSSALSKSPSQIEFVSYNYDEVMEEDKKDR